MGKGSLTSTLVLVSIIKEGGPWMAGTVERDNERRVATEEAGQHERHRILPHYAIARRQGDGTEWFAKECYPSELVSLLTGPYAGVEWVLLDPLPGCLVSKDRPTNLMRSDNFVDYLSGLRTASGSSAALAPAAF